MGFLGEVIYDLVPLVLQYFGPGIQELLPAPVLLLDKGEPQHQQLQFLDEDL